MFHAPRNTSPACIAILLAALFAACAIGAFAADTPRLDGAKIYPLSGGDTNTLFTFTIVYFGATAPSGHYLHLDSAVFAMNNAGAAPYGGTMYTYHTKLAAGTHKYRFRFQVGDQTLRKPGPSDNEWYTSPTVKQAPSCTISGVIKANGVALERVDVKLTKSGSNPVTVGTNSQGRYTAKGLAPGTWTVAPSKTGYTMTPQYRKVTGPPDTTTCDFTATRTS